mgnify:CR=1 FL=1
MTEPAEIIWKISVDRHGRYTRVVAKRLSNGERDWSIRSDPVSQRDEGEAIHSLTTRQLQEIAEIIKLEGTRR